MNDEPLRRVQWVKFRNDHSTAAPPCAVLRVTGYITDAEEPYFTVGQPNTYGSQYSHAINDEFWVQPDEFGYCCLGQMAPARYNGSDGTPAFGELWGPRDGEWFLKKNTPGFSVLGPTGDDSDLRVIVTPSPFLRFRGVALAESLEGSDDNEVAIYYNGATYGIYGDTGVTFENVVNEFGDFDNGAILEVVWEGDGAGLRWKIIQATCPAA